MKLTIKKLLSNPRKWIKGQNEAKIGYNEYAYCLRGACLKVYDNSNEYYIAMQKLRNAIAKLSKKAAHNISITMFNDSPCTNFEKIKLVLDMANV